MKREIGVPDHRRRRAAPFDAGTSIDVPEGFKVGTPDPRHRVGQRRAAERAAKAAAQAAPAVVTPPEAPVTPAPEPTPPEPKQEPKGTGKPKKEGNAK